MSTAAQVSANQANSQHSTGPRSAEGRASSAKNSFRHGLTGPFVLLGWENPDEFQALESNLVGEHQPATPTERILVCEMAQSHWLRQRAIMLQHACLNQDHPTADEPKELALYLRYQTTHSRAFYKALTELQRLREQTRKQDIGFVSQKRREEQQALTETRRTAAEHRAQELHEARVWLTEAHARRHETETTIAQVLRMPKPAASNSDHKLQNAA